MKLVGYKFKVLGQANSNEIQKRLFAMGYRWNSTLSPNTCKFQSEPFLFARTNEMKLAHGSTPKNFIDSEFNEMKILHEEQERMIRSVVWINLESLQDDSIIPIWAVLVSGMEKLETILKNKIYSVEDITYLNAIRNAVANNDGRYTR